MHARSLIVPLAMLVLAGCKPPSDLGSSCQLVRRNPDGGRNINIREGDIKAAASKDFISFGTIECENLTCVRDADFSRDGGSDGGGTTAVDPNALAVGYCSDKCLQGSTCPSSNPADDNDAKKRLNCRPLLLDSETLNALCSAGQCLPGGIKSPYFCARGGIPGDAGF